MAINDNEMLLLIYETMQKQLGQMKDSRVVIQSLEERTKALEELMENMAVSSVQMSERLQTLEKAVVLFSEGSEIGLEKTARNSVRLAHTVDAMRDTVNDVVVPSISIVAETHKDIKAEIRELSSVHKSVMDEFEHYQLRMLQLEDIIKKLLNNQLSKNEASENEE